MKLRPEALTKYVLSRIGVKDPAIIVGPTVGEDSAVIDLGNGNVLVVHSDPITRCCRTSWMVSYTCTL